MTVPANTAKRTKRWKALIGADEYQGHTSNIEITTQSVSWMGGDGNTISDDGDVSVVLTIAQDTENEDSLWRLLNDNVGQQIELELFPHYDGTFSQTVKVAAVRPPLKATRGAEIPEVQVTLTGTLVPAA